MRWAVLALLLQTSPPGTLHPALAQPGRPIPLAVGGTIAPAVPLYDGPWISSAPLLKIQTDPIISVALVPTEKGWLLVAGSRRTRRLEREEIEEAGNKLRGCEKKLQEWSDWEAMLQAQLERVVGGRGRSCDSLVETLRLRLGEVEAELAEQRQLKERYFKAGREAEADVARLREALKDLETVVDGVCDSGYSAGEVSRERPRRKDEEAEE